MASVNEHAGERKNDKCTQPAVSPENSLHKHFIPIAAKRSELSGLFSGRNILSPLSLSAQHMVVGGQTHVAQSVKRLANC